MTSNEQNKSQNAAELSDEQLEQVAGGLSAYYAVVDAVPAATLAVEGRAIGDNLVAIEAWNRD